MSVHYKFKSNLDHDTVTFDGLNISVADLKKSIMQQKKIGKSSDFDLQITNAQTKEVYDNDEMLVPKNTSVIVARVPVQGGSKKNWDKPDLPLPIDDDDLGHIRYDRIAKNADLINANTSEEDKVKAMITQSSVEYDPSKYMKSRNMTGPLPPTYTCFRCGKTGHWIKNCPTNNPDVKRSTGIPRSFMVPVDGPEHKGALLTSSGDYAVPLIDHQAYKEVKKEKPPFVPQDEPAPEPEAQIPEELLCMVCKDLLQDAVLIPCCGNSFCDECVRQVLLESDNHECPVCNESDVSPNTLIPNRFLRTAVLNFKNETGYTRVKKAAFVKSSPIPERNLSPQPSPDSTVESQSQSESAALQQPETTLEPVEKKKGVSEPEILPIKEEIPNLVEQNSDKDVTPELKVDEDSEEAQPGTPLADEPVDDVVTENCPIQTIGQEQYVSNKKSYDYSAHSKYSRSHREDYKRHYKEDSPPGPRPISTIETITNMRKNKFNTRPAPVRQQFLNQHPHRDDRCDSYSQEDEYHNRYDKRHHMERGPQKNHHSHFDRSSRPSRYHQPGNIRQYADNEHSRQQAHYDVPVHNDEPVRKHQDRYRSPPQSVLIPPTIPPTVYAPPPPSVPIPPPAIIPPPQVYPPQPPPPGASPIDTSHLGAQPPPPGVGPLLPPSLSGDTNPPFVSRSYESEDPLKDAKKKDERSIDDRLEAFQRELEKRDREHPRDRVSRSRSRSSDRHRSRSRSYSSKSWSHSPSRSLSRTPRSRSRTPFSSRSRSRSYSYSRSRSWSKNRSYTRSRSRTRTESRSRSRSRMRRRGHSRERMRSPRPRTRSRSFSPKDYRLPSHRNIPYTGKHTFTPPQYGGSYPSQYGPPPNILPMQVMRPPTYPPHHIHPIAPVQPLHSRPIDHYPVDRVPKYPSSYNDQYPAYDSYPHKYQNQRFDREQRGYDKNLGYDKNVRYDKRQEYQRHEEEAPHRIPGWVGERPREYKPRYRQSRDQRKEIKELPKVQEHEMRVSHVKEPVNDPPSKREERKTVKNAKEREEKVAVKYKKHHHHHKSKENKKYESKSSAVVGVEKETELYRNKSEETSEIRKESNEVLESEAKVSKNNEKVKDKKHKHKKHKLGEQVLKKKRAIKKEKVEAAPSTDSDLPTKVKVKKKKSKLKQPVVEDTVEESDPRHEKVLSPVISEQPKPESDIISESVNINLDKITEDSDLVETLAEEPDAEVTEFITEELREDEPLENEMKILKEEVEESENIEESNNTEEEEMEDEDVLRVDVPGLSKWERDSGAEEVDEDFIKPARRSSIVLNKEETLPSEIIQKAEKVFLSHQMKPRIGTKDASDSSKDSSDESSCEASPSKPKDSVELKSVIKTERLPASDLRVTVSKERRSVHSKKEDSNSRDDSQARRFKHDGKSKHREEDITHRAINLHSSKTDDRVRESRVRISDRRDRRYSPKRETTASRNSSRDPRDYVRKQEPSYKDEDNVHKEERRHRFAEPVSRHVRPSERSRESERSDRKRSHLEAPTESKSRREKEIVRSSDNTHRSVKYKRSRSRSFESVDSHNSYKKRSEQPKSQTLKTRDHHQERSNLDRIRSEQVESSSRRKHSPIKPPEKHISSFTKSSRKDDFDALKFEPDYDEFSDVEEKVVESKDRSKRKSATPEVSRKRIKVDKAEEPALSRRIEKSSNTSSASSSAVSASESSDSEDQKGSKSKSSDTDYKQKHKKSRHKKHKKHKHKHKKKKSHRSRKD